MKHFLIILIVFNYCFCKSQDKLFFKTGEVKNGIIVSILSDYLLFKTSDTSVNTYRIPKSEIIMAERYDGRVFIFTEKKSRRDSTKHINGNFKRNFLSVQPFNLLFGRATICYERLNKEGTFGVVIPAIITFDPIGTIYRVKSDSAGAFVPHNSGINFIGGLDLNFYIGKKDNAKFFLGPRIRYGVDMFLRNIEAYSIQTQFGWRLGKPENTITQHFSVGFGFARILSSQAANRISPKQSYGWGSINYRIGFNW